MSRDGFLSVLILLLLGILALGAGVAARYALEAGTASPALVSLLAPQETVPAATINPASPSIPTQPNVTTTSSNPGGISNENAPQTRTLEISSVDKETNTTYSTLRLTISPEAFSTTIQVGMLGVAATQYDQFLGGSYYLRPQGQELLIPATVSITYNDAAVALYKKIHPSFKERNLTLSYFDNTTMKYTPIDSAFDGTTRTVTGNISELFGDGLVIQEKNP